MTLDGNLRRRIVYGAAAPIIGTVVAVAVSSVALLIAGKSPITTFQEMSKAIDGTEFSQW